MYNFPPLGIFNRFQLALLTQIQPSLDLSKETVHCDARRNPGKIVQNKTLPSVHRAFLQSIRLSERAALVTDHQLISSERKGQCRDNRTVSVSASTHSAESKYQDGMEKARQGEKTQWKRSGRTISDTAKCENGGLYALFEELLVNWTVAQKSHMRTRFFLS